MTTNKRPTLYEVSNIFVSWETEGQTIEGRIVSCSPVALSRGVSLRYALDTPDAGRVAFLAPVRLADTLADMPISTYVCIVYRGIRPGENIKNFAVQAEKYSPLDTPRRLVDMVTGEIISE